MACDKPPPSDNMGRSGPAKDPGVERKPSPGCHLLPSLRSALRSLCPALNHSQSHLSLSEAMAIVAFFLGFGKGDELNTDLDCTPYSLGAKNINYGPEFVLRAEAHVAMVAGDDSSRPAMEKSAGCDRFPASTDVSEAESRIYWTKDDAGRYCHWDITEQELIICPVEFD